MTTDSAAMKPPEAALPWPRWQSGVVSAIILLGSLGSLVARGGDDAVIDAAAKRQPDAGQRHQQINLEQQMNAMFFPVAGSVDKTRERFLGRLLLEVSALDNVCGLSDRQHLKCETAAKLDLARWIDEIDVVRRRYAGSVVDLQDPDGQSEWQRFQKDAQAAQAKMQAADSDAGLLPRVIAGILDDEQRSDWQRESELRVEYQWRSLVDAGMAHLDIALGLTAAQHEAIRKLLEEKPLRINQEKIRAQGGHFAPFICRYGLSRIDRKRLDAVVNQRQRKALGQFIDQGRGMTEHLKRQKIIVE